MSASVSSTSQANGVPLSEEDQAFARWLSASVIGHVILIAVVATVQLAGYKKPVIDVNPPVTVDLIVAALDDPAGGGQKRGLPNKETFVPIAAPERPPEPEVVIPDKKPPVEDPKPPTEVREAKTLEEAIRKDPPPITPDPGLDEQARNAMAELIRAQVEAQRRKEAIAKLTGVPGLRNRSAGSGTGTGEGDGSGLGGNAMGIDPAWARALNEKIQPLWIVLPTLANKDLRVIVFVSVDTEGNVREAEVRETSSEPGLDGSAIRAVMKARTLPLPTKPDLKRAVLADGFELAFNPRGLAP